MKVSEICTLIYEFSSGQSCSVILQIIPVEKEGWINARFFTVHVSGTMMDTYGIIDSLTRTMDRRCFYG